MRNTLITLLGIDNGDNEALANLDLLIYLCTDEAVNFTNNTADNLEALITMMVQERWSKLDSMGVSSASYSGVSETYVTDYSEAVQRLIRSKRKLKVV